MPDLEIEQRRCNSARFFQALHYSRSFGCLPWLDVLVVMLKPLIATSLDELSRKTLWTQLMEVDLIPSSDSELTLFRLGSRLVPLASR